MKTKEAIDRAGSTNALAALLEVTPSAVSQWGENLPKAREWQLRLLKPKWFREEDARAKALAASIVIEGQAQGQASADKRKALLRGSL